MKFGNLVEICFLLNLAVKGLILDFVGNYVKLKILGADDLREGYFY